MKKTNDLKFSSYEESSQALRLIGEGYHPDSSNKNGKTIMMLMVEEISLRLLTIEQLISSIDKYSPNLDAENKNGNTAVFHTIDMQIIEVLVNLGANINHQNKKSETIYSKFYKNPFECHKCEQLEGIGACTKVTDDEKVEAEQKRTFYSYDFNEQISSLGFDASLKKALSELPLYEEAVVRYHSDHLIKEEQWIDYIDFNLKYEKACGVELFLYIKNILLDSLTDWRVLYLIIPRKSISKVYSKNIEEIELIIDDLAVSYFENGIFPLINNIEMEYKAYSKWITEEKLGELRTFFLSQKSFDNCSWLDWDRSIKFRKDTSNIGNVIFVPRVRPMVKHAIEHIVLGFFIEGEKLWRKSNGLPDFDYKWKSEAELFIFLKKRIPSAMIEMHASPRWLGRQHFDIYFPEYGIAVEYQGEQHSKAIEFFGGEEGLKQTKLRDKKKKKLAKENNCTLIYAYPDMDESLVLEEVEKVINSLADSN